MTPTFGNTDFSGGLNVRDLGHLIAPNEATVAEGFELDSKSVRTLPGDIRTLIDAVTYPEIAGVPGSGGGTPNDEPILGQWRYYYNDGMTAAANSWVRVHGNTCEYWNPTTGRWVTIGANWPAAAIPSAVTFENTIYILANPGAAAYSAKYLYWDGAAFQAGDAPVPGAPLANLRPSFAAAYKNRLYAVDVVNEPFRLRYSGVDLPEDWVPPNGGYVTYGEDTGDPITGLFVHKGILLVFKRASVWRYWRDDYGFEHIDRIHGASGCIAYRSICAYKDAVYYVSDDGMMAIYGADSDCITHKINDDIDPDPDYIDYIQAVVLEGGPEGGTLWVTYLESIDEETRLDECGDPVLDECGDPVLNYVYNTDVWRADIRRPNIIKPRWVKLPYYRLTAFAMPPQCSSYKGEDRQRLRFAAQQPDVEEWNPDPAVTPDPLYPTNVQGGPRHYSYRHGPAFDRDQVPAYNDACEDQLYAGDRGIGYWLRFSTPRYIPHPDMLDVQFNEVVLRYFVWKSHAGQGMDVGYGRVWIDDYLLSPATATIPTEPTWWPIDDVTPDDPINGGMAHSEWTLSWQNPSNGYSITMEWVGVGTADRDVYSHAIEFGFFRVWLKLLRSKYNPDED
jgi:hypothetical protein